jgi:UDP-N-acetylglucosamine transferase subunit ALG13
MIFVTVGSIGFDSLVRQVDEAVGRGDISAEVILQVANGRYAPVHCEYFRTAPGLDPYYRRADLVIGHGGTGTTLEIVERGLRLISVSNPSMIDNHQREFLEMLEARGFTTYCRELLDLPALIRSALAKPPPPPADITCFFRTVIDDLEGLEPR